MCTYKLRRDKKRKGFGDSWEAKRGLTRCDTGEFSVLGSQFSVSRGGPGRVVRFWMGELGCPGERIGEYSVCHRICER